MPLDEFHGQGGSYAVNDKGVRVLVERTLSQEEAAAKAEQEAAAAKGSTKPAKEK